MATYETLTPGGHGGPDVAVHRRGDGVVLRLQQADAYIEAFLNIEQCHQLDLLLDEVVVDAQRHQHRQDVRDEADQQA